MDKKENTDYNNEKQLIENLLTYIREVEFRYDHHNFGMSTIDVLEALKKCLTGKYGK